ncbi:WecB/TagA/CpsF family glycosyltransferase [Halanaerobium praevalens]|uniref:N-acetylglucosaminyldiphosphoundecaprenol N-acetyl-beta-D-mannosaminyltransferase n=1 Tax=Halanaerobium praevalens (strain ATCC 33744 / DSM 2228 / GSL) TaxID=572479 RepID=E3DR47_HALPG|nr:WecB/TagA/CpsF family glycosyltransferase [Halanaerobium praevalens]ADO78036.1 N-acetylmannosaminyltransferase [Halanaerobium praevalens DSM 2228]
MRKLINILGVNIDQFKMREAVARVKNLINTQSHSALVVTPNSEILALASENENLARILNSADLATADGIGVVLASKIMGEPLAERVAGFDLISNLFKEFAASDLNFYFLGSKPGIVEKAIANLKNDYPQINIVGAHHGYLDQASQKKVFREINESKVDLLLVGMGFPLQEKFLDQNLAQLDVGVAITVGGSFDVLAGEVNRAPLWVQRIGLEWLYRLLQEPSRFKRILLLPKFLYLVIKARFLA